MTLRIPVLLKLLWDAIRGWSRDDVPRLGASLAYYALLSLAPILIIAIAIAGAAFGRDAVRGQIVGEIGGLIGRDGALVVQSMLQNALRQRAGTLAVVLGSLAFLGASLGAFLELQHALNTIFKVKTDVPKARSSKPWLIELVQDRLKSFGLVLAIGFLLLVSLTISAALSAAASWTESLDIGGTLLWQGANLLVSLAAITVLFALIYRFLPDVRLRWREVWVGGFITALLFSLGKQLIGLYLGRSTVASTYGAAGSVVVLLLWVYYSAEVVLLGAEFTRVYVEFRGKHPRPKGFARRAPRAHPNAPGPAEHARARVKS